MKFKKMAAVLSLLFFVGQSISGMAQNMVKNGAFDGNPSHSQWQLEVTNTYIANQQTGGNPGGYVWLNHAGWWHSDPAVKQTITGFQPGSVYIISGDYRGGNQAGIYCRGGGPALAVDVDGYQIKYFNMPNPYTKWTTFSASFTATSTSHTLRFRGEIYGRDCDVALDNIKVVPEFSGTVIATAFYDANENGLVDEGEKAVTDAIVRHPEGDKTTKHYTLQNGRAVFNNLAEGVQSFYVDMNSLPDGTQSTTENSVQVTLSPELNLIYLWFGFSGDLADRLGDEVVVPDDQSNDKCNPLVFVKGSPTYSDGKNSYGWENAADCDLCSEAGATYAMADPATGDSAPWAVYEFVDKSTRQFDYVKFQSGFCQDPGNDRQDGLSKSQSMGYRVRKIEVLVSTTGMDAANFTSVGVFKDKYSEHELQWNKLASAVQAKYVKLRLLDPVVDGMYTQIVEFEVDNSNKTGAQPAREAGQIAAVESAGLLSNYPNPFNPSTTIQYHLDEAAQVSLKVYDVTGKLVAELANEFVTAGSHIVTWNAADMPSGVYFVTMQSGAQSATRRLLLMK